MKLKLYFMGSGEIAVPVIDKLYSSEKIELLGICTQEDKPAGRKMELTSTPVGAWAKNKGIFIDKIHSVNSDEFIGKLKALSPDVVLVISFGQILKEPLLNTPSFGCINIHASLLPKYRGASPICAAILNGDNETGVCFTRMERGLDSGPVFEEIRYPLNGTETSDKLELELGKLSAQYAEETLIKIFSGELKCIPQDASIATIAPKVKKSDGLINWKNRTAFQVERMVRAYHPWPGAYTFIPVAKGPKKIIITSAIAGNSDLAIPSRIERADKNTFEIGACAGTSLNVQRLIPEGRKEMTAEEFLRGTRVEVGSECVNL